MIGRRCKARERLSRAPLIGRALRDTFNVPSAPDRSQEETFLKRCAAPRAPCERHPALTQPAPQRPPGAGGSGGRGTPGPIPNPEVKPASADGTAGATLWESRAPPAPGARCAGSGRGGAREAPGRGGPERFLFRLKGFFPPAAKKKGRRHVPPRAAGGLLRSGASRPRCAAPDGAFRSAVGAGPPSDVAPLKRRRADLVGRSRARFSSGRPGSLYLWGPPGSHLPC